MSNLELDTVAALFTVGAAFAAVVVGLIGVARFVATVWRRTVGRRRTQARTLDQLACGSTLLFVEELLGTPKFVRTFNGREERLYRLPGAWVSIEPHKQAVMAYTITITRRSMYYSTRRLTFGLVDINLGKSTFADIPHDSLSEKVWFGARKSGYLQHHYFGNPGAYQDFWFSYNLCGCGHLDRAVNAGDFSSGRYGASNGSPPQRSAITVNTLTVLGPDRAPQAEDEFMQRDILGADSDFIRLDATDRPAQPSLRMRWRRAAG